VGLAVWVSGSVIELSILFLGSWPILSHSRSFLFFFFFFFLLFDLCIIRVHMICGRRGLLGYDICHCLHVLVTNEISIDLHRVPLVNMPLNYIYAH
jgi:hypothetical protein